MKTMKTSLRITKPIYCLIILAVYFISGNQVLNAQITPELIFNNPSLESGNGGSNGAIYRFPSVKPNVDALVTLKGRSSSSLTLVSIDQSGSGYRNAFQPEVTYNNGSTSSAVTYWMDFEIKFVAAGTTTPVGVSFYLTALDIDGDNNNLHEWDAFYSPFPNSYTLETPTLLSVSNFSQIINGNNTVVGKRFDGPTTLYTAGVDSATKKIMTTLNYNNVTMVNFRAGATTTSSSSMTMRMYSAWFKNFTYNAPLVTLPVKLNNFTAMLHNNKAELNWSTSSEINASHFVVQRSTDGISFKDAGIVFAAGNSTDLNRYSFNDNLLSITNSVVYYRLCTVDIDGKTEFSDVRMIRLTGLTENKLSILAYPNPVSSELRVTIPAAWQNKNVTFEIIQFNGQSISRMITSNAGQTQIIDVHSLPQGNYLVVAICDNERATARISKQ
jgi:hypothetical protein